MKTVITKGLGSLTPSVWKRIIEAVLYIENTRGNNSSGEATGVDQNVLSSFFLAKITSVGVLKTDSGFPVRWKYAWSRVQLSNDATVEPITTGDFALLAGTLTAGSTASFAININELGNTAALQCGYDINTGSNEIYDADGFTVQPIMVGQCVLMQTIRITGGGRAQYIFNCPNPINGMCPLTFDGGGGVGHP